LQVSVNTAAVNLLRAFWRYFLAMAALAGENKLQTTILSY